MEILSTTDVSYIDNILLKDGELQPVPSEVIKKIKYSDLRVWCHNKAVYGLPTIELIDFLRSIIGDDIAIEVGAGCGVFGRTLGITSTDSMIQQKDARMVAYYKLLRQPPVEYGKNVLDMEASEAIKTIKPAVVFGSWVTQYISPLLDPPPGGGSVFGLRESEFIRDIKKYIVYGNEDIHGFKLLFNEPGVKVIRHKNTDHFWSRATNHKNNTVYEISQETR